MDRGLDGRGLRHYGGDILGAAGARDQPAAWAVNVSTTTPSFARRPRLLPALLRGLALAVAGVALLIALCLAILSLLDWNGLKGPIAGLAAAAIGRPVAIEGRLTVKVLSLTPSARFERLRIGQPDWALGARPNMIDARGLLLEFDAPALLTGRVALRGLAAERLDLSLMRAETGRANWRLGEAGGPAAFRLVGIRRLAIGRSDLLLRDSLRDIALHGSYSAGAVGDRFRVEAEGLTWDRDFRFAFEGPALEAGRAPYPFQIVAALDTLAMEASGELAAPLDFGAFTGSARVRGADAGALFHLLAAPIPNTPPFRLVTKIERHGAVTRLFDLSGAVGDTDLRGTVTIDAAAARPLVTADLASSRLDFDDLAALFGAPPSAKLGETISEAELRLAGDLEKRGRVLPGAKLRSAWLRRTDARVRYRAHEIGDAAPLPLAGASLEARLDQGVLRVDPIAVDLRNGVLRGSALLDASKDKPTVAIDLRLVEARLEDFAGHSGARGGLEARARLRGQGLSVREVAASAEGAIAALVFDAEIGPGLLAPFALAPAGRSARLRCAVMELGFANGVGAARVLAADAEAAAAAGVATVRLPEETLEIRLDAQPKGAGGPPPNAVTIAGTLRAPSLAPAQPRPPLGIGDLLAPAARHAAGALDFVSLGAPSPQCAPLLALAAEQKNAPDAANGPK